MFNRFSSGDLKNAVAIAGLQLLSVEAMREAEATAPSTSAEFAEHWGKAVVVRAGRPHGRGASRRRDAGRAERKRRRLGADGSWRVHARERKQERRQVELRQRQHQRWHASYISTHKFKKDLFSKINRF